MRAEQLYSLVLPAQHTGCILRHSDIEAESVGFANQLFF